MTKTMKPEFTIRNYTQKEMASHYRTTTKTFRRWLYRAKPDLGPKIGNSYSPRQVKRIVEALGEPERGND